jgi:hypothetical protein
MRRPICVSAAIEEIQGVRMDNIDANTWVLLIVALLTAINTYYSRRTEKNTNSMKDALVEAASKEGHAKGLKQGRDEKNGER